MPYNSLKTDFAIFQPNEENATFKKQYLPSFTFLANLDFQNSRNFGNESPFFIPQNQTQHFPLKNLQKLSDWQKKYQFDAKYTEKCFQISQKLIDSLKRIHQKKIIYGCLSANNIFVDKTNNLWFSEWSFASANNSKTFENSIFLETSLIDYIAPEQTNRNETSVNFKTDLYALGVVLYQLFTQNNPFSSKNELDSIYKHRTLVPALPSILNKKMGLAVSQVILKLLEKNPENRFSSIESCEMSFNIAFALFTDKKLDENIDFESQNPHFFSINELILSNFQNDLKHLEEIYSETLQKNIGSVCFIEGQNGIQKSVFLNHFFSTIEAEDTLSVAISLKNDQNTPLASIRELLRTITNYYLTRPNDELLNFRNIATNRLGLARNVLHEIYPTLAQILPISTESSQVKGLDLRSQLIFAIAEFLKSFIQSQKKLLIHFRGFQFTTNNTFGIIEGILRDLPLEKLSFLFSYEEDLLEDSQKDFIKKQLESNSNLLKVNQLRLFSVRKNDFEEILKQAKVFPADVALIAEILLAKTNGLPNFLNRAIDELIEKDKIIFDETTQYWHFEKEGLLAVSNFSGNMSEYFEKQYKAYDEPTQKLLNDASLIGDIFQKNVLAFAFADPHFEEIFDRLIIEGIFKSSDNSNDFGFIDINLRKTCLQFLSTEQILLGEEKLIQSYLALYPEIEKSDYFFIFLNKVLHLPISIAKPYQQWIEIGLQITQKIADFDVALQCSETLLNFVSENDWEQNQAKVFQIHNDYMMACAFCLKFEKTEEVYQKLFARPKTKTQDLFLTLQFSEALVVHHDYKRSMELCITALKKEKIDISNDPSLLRIIFSSVRMGFLMKGKDFEFFKNLPAINDEGTIYKILLLQSMVGSAFIVNPKMISELVFKQADFSIKNGFSLNLGICLSCFAFMSANFQKKYDDSKKYFDLGQQINEIIKDNRTHDVNMFIYACFIQPWFYSFKVTAQQLLDNFYHCRQSGYLYLASYNTSALPFHLILGEINLPETQNKIKEVLPFIHANLTKNADDSLILAAHFCQELMSKVGDEMNVDNQDESWDDMSIRVKQDLDTTKRSFLAFHDFYLSFLHEKYEIDRNEVIFCQKNYKDQGEGYFQMYLNFYFVSLNYIKLGRNLDSFELKYVKNTIKALAEIAKINPLNFQAKAMFIDGLYDLREKRTNDANMKLQKAFELAIKSEHYLTAALASRELGQLYEILDLPTQSIEHFRLAVKYFQLYGSTVLSDNILQKYPQLQINQTQTKVLNIGQKIDLQSFINASTSISAEIKLESLLEKLMLVLVENAGAEIVYFIVPNQSGFDLIASKTKAGIETSLQTELNEQNAPTSILHYVSRSRKYVLLENASKNTIYKNDPYIRTKNILSVVCLPVVKNNELIGIIYLENNLLTNAFTTESTDTLNLLASQIAISFENSQLYNNMEKKVLERTNELLIEKDKSEKLLLNILPSEVAQELKEFGHSEAKLYNNVTVLFADFVGFTKLSEKLSPKELIDEVDEYFKAFDLIMEEHGLEKIKTIGDAYLAVCGLPNAVETNGHNTIRASKAIMEFVDNQRVIKKKENKTYFDIRIGVHSGPVIAGIVGLKKFAYDIWGDTVNTAARMEQACEPNKINISDTTYQHVKDDFGFLYRGKIDAKNKGSIDMYYLE